MTTEPGPIRGWNAPRVSLLVLGVLCVLAGATFATAGLISAIFFISIGALLLVSVFLRKPLALFFTRRDASKLDAGLLRSIRVWRRLIAALLAAAFLALGVIMLSLKTPEFYPLPAFMILAAGAFWGASSFTTRPRSYYLA